MGKIKLVIQNIGGNGFVGTGLDLQIDFIAKTLKSEEHNIPAGPIAITRFPENRLLLENPPCLNRHSGARIREIKHMTCYLPE